MRDLFTLIFLLVLRSNLGYCQLLNSPDLTLNDFEVSLSDPDHLNEILNEHTFKFEKFENEDCIISECWYSKMETEETSRPALVIKNPVLNICMFEYKLNHEPRPGVTKSIDIQIFRDPEIADKLDMLVEDIKSSYPDEEIKSVDISNSSIIYRKKGSEIEVEIIKSQTEISKYDWYLIIFYLYTTPYF